MTVGGQDIQLFKTLSTVTLTHGSILIYLQYILYTTSVKQWEPKQSARASINTHSYFPAFLLQTVMYGHYFICK
jgi:hypothetical protein